jgi:hypothetical protein
MNIAPDRKSLVKKRATAPLFLKMSCGPAAYPKHAPSP